MKTYEQGYTDGYNAFMKAVAEKKKTGPKLPTGGTMTSAYKEGFIDGWNAARRELGGN